MTAPQPRRLVKAIGIGVATLTFLITVVISPLEEGHLGAFCQRLHLCSTASEPAPAPAPQPATQATGAQRKITLTAQDGFDLCGKSFGISFGYRGSALADFAFLIGDGKSTRIALHEKLDIPPACSVTLTRLDRNSREFAELTVTE